MVEKHFLYTRSFTKVQIFRSMRTLAFVVVLGHAQNCIRHGSGKKYKVSCLKLSLSVSCNRFSLVMYFRCI